MTQIPNYFQVDTLRNQAFIIANRHTPQGQRLLGELTPKRTDTLC